MKVGDLVTDTRWWNQAQSRPIGSLYRVGLVVRKQDNFLWVKFVNGKLECHHLDLLEVIDESR